MARRKVVCLFCLGLHFLLLLLVCARDTFSILSEGGNILPRSLDKRWSYLATFSSTLIGERLSLSNPIRQGVAAYLHGAGIEAGYAFFAPNVPNSYKLVFEVHYSDGRIEYALPEVHGGATGLRLVSLFDYIGRTQYAPLRELMFKMLAYSIWRERPGATTISAVFGYVDLPTPEQFSRGEKESYEFLYAYDFDFRSPAGKPKGVVK